MDTDAHVEGESDGVSDGLTLAHEETDSVWLEEDDMDVLSDADALTLAHVDVDALTLIEPDVEAQPLGDGDMETEGECDGDVLCDVECEDEEKVLGVGEEEAQCEGDTLPLVECDKDGDVVAEIEGETDVVTDVLCEGVIDTLSLVDTEMVVETLTLRQVDEEGVGHRVDVTQRLVVRDIVTVAVTLPLLLVLCVTVGDAVVDGDREGLRLVHGVALTQRVGVAQLLCDGVLDVVMLADMDSVGHVVTDVECVADKQRLGDGDVETLVDTHLVLDTVLVRVVVGQPDELLETVTETVGVAEVLEHEVADRERDGDGVLLDVTQGVEESDGDLETQLLAVELTHCDPVTLPQRDLLGLALPQCVMVAEEHREGEPLLEIEILFDAVMVAEAHIEALAQCDAEGVCVIVTVVVIDAETDGDVEGENVSLELHEALVDAESLGDDDAVVNGDRVILPDADVDTDVEVLRDADSLFDADEHPLSETDALGECVSLGVALTQLDALWESVSDELPLALLLALEHAEMESVTVLHTLPEGVDVTVLESQGVEVALVDDECVGDMELHMVVLSVEE